MTTGAKSRINFLWEDNGFRQAPTDSDYKVFGGDTRITTREGSHNAVRVFNPGSREAVDIIEQNFEGSLSIEFKMATPWFLRGVIAKASTSGVDTDGDGNADYYEHTFDGETMTPMRVVIGDEGGSDENIIKGVVAGSATINVEAGGEFVPVTLECAYAESTLDENVTSLTAQDTLSYEPFHFGHGSVQIGGSTIARIQSAELTIENNVDLVYELGDRLPVDYSPKQRTPDVNLTKIKEPNPDRLKDFYGGDTSVGGSVDNMAKLDLDFVRATDDNVKFDLGGTIPESYDASTIGDPKEDIEEDLTRYAKTVSAVAANTTATAR